MVVIVPHLHVGLWGGHSASSAWWVVGWSVIVPHLHGGLLGGQS